MFALWYWNNKSLQRSGRYYLHGKINLDELLMVSFIFHSVSWRKILKYFDVYTWLRGGDGVYNVLLSLWTYASAALLLRTQTAALWFRTNLYKSVLAYSLPPFIAYLIVSLGFLGDDRYSTSSTCGWTLPGGQETHIYWFNITIHNSYFLKILSP